MLSKNLGLSFSDAIITNKFSPNNYFIYLGSYEEIKAIKFFGEKKINKRLVSYHTTMDIVLSTVLLLEGHYLFLVSVSFVSVLFLVHFKSQNCH